MEGEAKGNGIVKLIVHFIIMLGIVFGFRVLPAPGSVTPLWDGCRRCIFRTGIWLDVFGYFLDQFIGRVFIGADRVWFL